MLHTLATLPSVLGVSTLLGMASAVGKHRSGPLILDAADFQHYIRTFNKDDEQLYPGHIKNDRAWAFLRRNIPLLDCPDKALERHYYFRWWTYRKHIAKTPVGFVITEFLPDVSWSGPYNTINCAAGHHIREGRWLHDRRYINDYLHFWLSGQGRSHQYSFWAADSVWQNYLVTHDQKRLTASLAALMKIYEGWVEKRGTSTGLFWQEPDRDGMEFSAADAPGFRPSINSYMFGDATAIARIARLADEPDVASVYDKKAARLKELTLKLLWNKRAQFFETRTMPDRDQQTMGPSAAVREEVGFTPWYFDLPPDQPTYAAAWKQLMDPKGFYAPFGPTTCEQRSRRFHVLYEGHECRWNGPSWPFATSITLTAMANFLHNYPGQNVITRTDYFKQLSIYVKSQHLTKPDGQTVPWIDEDLDPYTGTWIAHKLLLERNAEPYLRGKDYNHSTFCDLVITGLIGLRPQPDDSVQIKPLVPPGRWDYFCLDHVLYHGRILTIVYDRTGEHYGRGKGLSVFADGHLIGHRPRLTALNASLAPQ